MSKVHPRFAEAVRHLYPDAKLYRDVIVQDDGDGPRLAEWNLPGNPPNDAEIEALLPEIDLTLGQSAQDDKLVATSFDGAGIMRALTRLLFSLTNDVRVLKGQQPITAAQFKTALKAQIRG